MPTRLFIFLLFLATAGRAQSPDLLKADLRFVRHQLETTHPALYRYTPKPAFDHFFDSLENAITTPMSEGAFIYLLSSIYAKLGDGHTMFLPSLAMMNDKRIPFFPFSVNYIGEQLFITENGSLDRSIPPGEEILRINGIATKEIMTALCAHQVRDAYNKTYPRWILDHFFAAYYGYGYGYPEQFSLELRDSTGNVYMKQLRALPKDSIRLLKNAPPETQGISLKLAGNTALLTIKSFDSSLLAALFDQSFPELIDQVFARINKEHIRHLIIDLRNNQGGDFENGRLLLSKLCLKPMQYLYGGEEARLIQPDSMHFTGDVYVLVNGGSFSNSTIVSACLENAHRAVFIGEETGGDKYVISGDPEAYDLPYTKIRAFISTTGYTISQTPDKGHGVIPTYTVIPTIKDVIQHKDVVLEKAMELINNKR